MYILSGRGTIPPGRLIGLSFDLSYVFLSSRVSQLMNDWIVVKEYNKLELVFGNVSRDDGRKVSSPVTLNLSIEQVSVLESFTVSFCS